MICGILSAGSCNTKSMLLKKSGESVKPTSPQRINMGEKLKIFVLSKIFEIWPWKWM